MGEAKRKKQQREQAFRPRTDYFPGMIDLHTLPDIGHDNIKDQWSSLVEIYPAPRWLWRPLVSRLVSEVWTVDAARREAQRLKD